MNRYSLSEETLNKILGYLGNKPYVESAGLVDAIRNDVKLIQNQEQTVQILSEEASNSVAEEAQSASDQLESAPAEQAVS